MDDRPVTADTPARQRRDPGRAAVLRNALAIGVTTGAYAVSFGAIATATGLSVLQTSLLSLLMFTGASQFAFVGVLAGGGGGLAAAVTAVVLSVRNLFYALRLSSVLGARGLRRVLAAQLVIDESTAMSLSGGSEELERLGFWATGISVYALWNLGTLLGALGAHALSDPRALGLDAAAPAAFLALLAPQVRSRRVLVIAVACAAVGLAMVPVLPVGTPVLLGGLVAVVVGASGRGTATATAGEGRP